MALVDNSQLLTTLYGLAGAKKSGNREQYQILKAQFDNDLLNIKLKNRTSSLSQLQSAYDKKDKALQEVTEQVDIYNRQREFFENPQKYPAWQSNPYTSASMLGAEHQAIKIQRDANWVKYLKEKYPQYHLAAGFAHSGAADAVQSRVANNELLQSGQAHPIVQQNIASAYTGTIPEQNTAIAAYNNSQANLMEAQTAQGESVQGKLALIDISYPEGGDAQQQQMRGIAIAKAFGIDENLAAALGMANKDELVSYLLAQAGASDPVQNVQAGIEPYAPQRPTNPAQSPGDKGRAAYEEERAKMLAAATQAKWTPKQIEEADQRLAAKYGLVPKPKDPSGAGGISTLTKDYYKGLVNIAIATANRFNVEGLPDGESIAFNDVAILLSLQNALTSEQLVGSSPEDLDTFARIFTAELGESIKQAGADGQSAVSQSMLNLVANGAQLHQKVLAALRISKEKGRRFTLADLGYTREEIAKIATTAARLTDDEVLTAGIKQLIPNYDELTRQPEPLAPAPTPKQQAGQEAQTEREKALKANERVRRITDDFKETTDTSYSWKIHRYDTKDIVGRQVKIKEYPGTFEVIAKEGNQYRVRQGNKDYLIPLSRVDQSSFVYKVGDTVSLSITSDGRKSYPLNFVVVQKGGEYITGAGKKVTLKDDEILLRAAEGNRRYRQNELLIVNVDAIKGKVD